MDETGDEFRWPIFSSPAGIAAPGWLSTVYIWWQASETEAKITTSLHVAEQARESLAADLQKLQKTRGLRRRSEKAGGGRQPLSEAAAARASAQNELADVNIQIGDAKLAVSGSQEEARRNRAIRRPSTPGSRKKATGLLLLQSQNQALPAEQSRYAGRD